MKKKNQYIHGSYLLSGTYDPQKKYKYTIAIPTFRRPELLRQTLLSAINQNISLEYEILVVDNEADNLNVITETEGVIQEFECDNLFYYQNESNLGMAGNWNRCIELARGDYITILHDDDWLEENFLKEVEKRNAGDSLLLFKPRIHDFRKVKLLDKYLRKIKYAIRNFIDICLPKKNLTVKDFYLRNPAYGTLGVIFKRNKLIQLGGFNAELYPIMDYILLTEYCQKEGAVLYKKKITNYRISINESFQCAKDTPCLLFEYRKYLEKQVPQECKQVRALEKQLYVSDIMKGEYTWNVNIEKPDYFISVKSSLKYKIFRIFMYIYMLFFV